MSATAFDPTNHGFFKLSFVFPGGVAVFELKIEGIDQPEHNTLRLNCHL
ncbi:MAG: hypothetical protein OXD29_09720 [Roseovarius sp.]|nr:hypothetical protein [Roseovarius sp.]